MAVRGGYCSQSKQPSKRLCCCDVEGVHPLLLPLVRTSQAAGIAKPSAVNTGGSMCSTRRPGKSRSNAMKRVASSCKGHREAWESGARLGS